MMSGHGTIDTAIEATRIGAYDFLEKPVSLQKLLNSINLALKKETITKYLKTDTHKKIKIIFIDENIDNLDKISEENILNTPDFSSNKDLIPDFSVAILNFYLSMNKHLGYKEFEISALNALRISNNIENIDVLDNIVFNLIKVTEGQKISLENVKRFLQDLDNQKSHKIMKQEILFSPGEINFNKPLKDAREEFEKLYFAFHLQKKLSISDLAKKSGVERTHLYRKLKSLGIKGK